MQGIEDIFDAWPTIGALAAAVGREYDAVLAWKLRRRIPEDAWDDVSLAAKNIGISLTPERIRQMNAPIKKRGRPKAARP